jgi:hypothetical protein
MITNMFIQFPAWLLAIVIFTLILIFIWVGIAYRKYEVRKGKDELTGGLGSLENSMLTLLGLLLAFTFGMGISKYEGRRENIILESNDIGTAILRCDMYPDSIRRILKTDFRNYVEARIQYYEAGTDPDKIKNANAESSVYSSKIWNTVLALPPSTDNLLRGNQMIPALNEMIDILSTRDADRIATIPPLIFVTLLLLTLTGSFLVGYDQSSSKRSKIFVIGFAFMTSVTIYLILELDRPRSGLINLNDAQQYMVNLRSMVE